MSSVCNNPTDIELRPSDETSYMQSRSPPSAELFPDSISVQHEAGEGAVLVVVAPVRLPAIQFDVNLVPGLEV